MFLGLPNPNPDPLVKGLVRIRTKMSRIRKADLEGSVRILRSRTKMSRIRKTQNRIQNGCIV